jgi:hypothetical protein
MTTPPAPFGSSTADLSAIAEQLCRIEHKLDLVVEHLAVTDPSFPLRELLDPRNLDPITHEPISYIQDLFKRHVVRRGGDSTNTVPYLQFDQRTTPTPQGNNNGSGNEGTGESG